MVHLMVTDTVIAIHSTVPVTGTWAQCFMIPSIAITITGDITEVIMAHTMTGIMEVITVRITDLITVIIQVDITATTALCLLQEERDTVHFHRVVQVLQQ